MAPYLLEYDALVKVTEAGALNSAVAQLKHLEGIANQTSGATAKWQDAQDQAARTAAGAVTLLDDQVLSSDSAAGKL